MAAPTVTDRIYLRDAQCRAFDAAVVAVEEGGGVALDATSFYATGGGQPHDTGTLAWEGGSAAVVDVRGHGPVVWHTLDGDPPAVGARVRGTLDWERRYGLMRTHTALHILCGVIYNTWGAAVTGGNMEPLRDADLIRTNVNLIPESVTREGSGGRQRFARRVRCAPCDPRYLK